VGTLDTSPNFSSFDAAHTLIILLLGLLIALEPSVTKSPGSLDWDTRNSINR